MIQDLGNIELFELLETDPKTQCTACLSYWNVGIVSCTRGHFLQKETEANRNFVKFSMDFRFQNTSSRKEDPMATDMGNIRRQRILSVLPIEEEMQKGKVPRNP